MPRPYCSENKLLLPEEEDADVAVDVSQSKGAPNPSSFEKRSSEITSGGCGRKPLLTVGNS